MTWYEAMGLAGSLLVFFAALALLVIVYSRLVDRAEAWWRVRRAALELGPETASAMDERRAARDLGYLHFDRVERYRRDVEAG